MVMYKMSTNIFKRNHELLFKPNRISCLVFFKRKKGKKAPVVKMQKKKFSEEDFKRKLKHPSLVPRGKL